MLPISEREKSEQLKCDLPNVSDLLGCGYYEKDETDY